ncbi:hypothetical protein [Budvicia aquatica]|uniref:hypothetical protein n=1 Tax=Budvicia aquatica TaxID=82979 RepID=UPI00207EE54C|nr:hypothetical protein [Budvicia aquatica]GKX51554.1 hypothetical protein SOASR029_18630 [Budvicia aquatica]
MGKDRKDMNEAELAACRERDIRYQKTRAEKLKELGDYQVTARLDKVTHKKLADLCEHLGYPRPKSHKNNLVEIYSAAVTHLINKEFGSRIHKPKSERAKELYRLYKTVSHLKYDEFDSNEDIIERMVKDKQRRPKAILEDTQDYQWADKDIKNMLREKAVTKKLQLLDGITGE